MTRAVTASRLTCGYGRAAVVRDLDLHIDHGEVVVLLGANGAGKTTALLTLAGLMAPLSGTLEVLGARGDDVRAARLAGRGLAMIPDDRGLLGGLTVKENLRVAGARRADDEAAALERFPELRTKLKLRAELLSGGEQQMLAIVRAVVRTPRLLLVDELSLGLAPIVVQRLIPSIVDLARSHDCGVLLVEQHVELALSVADRAYVLSHGNLAYSGSAATLLTDPELLQRSYLG